MNALSPSCQRPQDQPSAANHLPPGIEDQIDQAALKLSRGDAALWHHHRALLIGEHAIWQRGKSHWVSYLRTKALSQYPAVERSVICGWRKLLTKTMGIPPKRQAHKHAVSYAILFDSLRRKPGDQRSQVLKRRARTVYDAAKRGDTAFVRAVGRLLSGKGESDYLKRFKYAHAMLSHWLTAYYWLMPAKHVSYRLSLGLGVKDNLKSLLATKARYGLKSHRPTLIYGFERVRDTPGIEAIILTNPEGKRLLGPKGKPLPH